MVTSEIVVGTSFFSEIRASTSDFFGCRVNSFEEKLKSAREIATNEIIYKAINMNYNALI